MAISNYISTTHALDQREPKTLTPEEAQHRNFLRLQFLREDGTATNEQIEELRILEEKKLEKWIAEQASKTPEEREELLPDVESRPRCLEDKQPYVAALRQLVDADRVVAFRTHQQQTTERDRLRTLKAEGSLSPDQEDKLKALTAYWDVKQQEHERIVAAFRCELAQLEEGTNAESERSRELRARLEEDDSAWLRGLALDGACCDAPQINVSQASRLYAFALKVRALPLSRHGHRAIYRAVELANRSTGPEHRPLDEWQLKSFFAQFQHHKPVLAATDPQAMWRLELIDRGHDWEFQEREREAKTREAEMARELVYYDSNGLRLEPGSAEWKRQHEKSGSTEPFGPRPGWCRLTTFSEEGDNSRVEWIVKGILAKGQPALIAGPEKSFKTTTAVELALSIANAEPFLGRFAVPQKQRVAMLSCESGEAVLRETTLRIAQARGLPHESVMFGFELPDLTDTMESICWLIFMIQKAQLDVLILDPLYLLMGSGGNEGNIFAMGERFRALDRVIGKTGVTLVLLHHTRKRQRGFAPVTLDDVAWAGTSAWVRQWLLIGPRQRADLANGHFKMWLNVGGSAGQMGQFALDVEVGPEDARCWKTRLTDEFEARQQVRRDRESRSLARDRELELKVLCAVPQEANGATRSAVGKTAGVSNAVANKVLDELIQQGFVTVSQHVAGNRQTYPGVKLTEAGILAVANAARRTNE